MDEKTISEYRKNLAEQDAQKSQNYYFADTDGAVVNSHRTLYTASHFARSSLLHLQEIGSLKAMQPHTSARSELQSYLFFIVMDGKGTLTYKDKKYELSAGACVFIDCRMPYSHSTQDNLWSLQWIHFYGPTMQAIYDKYCERGGTPSFYPKTLGTYYSIHCTLFDLANSNDYMRDMKINQYLSELMVYIMAESWHPENKVLTPKRTIIMEIRDYLEKEYTRKITLDDLCSRFFISKHYMTHSFKEQFGLSINAYLSLVRITQAKRLLRFTDKTIEEIGYEVGIGPPHYFSRVFKEIEGVPPSIFREQW